MQTFIDFVDVTAKYRPEELDAISITLIADMAEVGTGTIPVPDEPGTFVYYSGQEFEVKDGGVNILLGYVGADSKGRGTTAGGTRVLPSITITDENAYLWGARSYNWHRPAETDRQRVLAFAAKYAPDLNTTWVLNTHTKNLQAKTYTTEEIVTELLGDIADVTGKTMFVVERSLHWHLYTEGDTAGLAISDDDTEYDYVTTFPPENPLVTRDPGELRNNVLAYNDKGQTYRYKDAASLSRYDSHIRHQGLISVPGASLASLESHAKGIVARAKDERITYECDIGPLTAAQYALIPKGSLISVTSQVMGLNHSTQRVAQIDVKYKNPGQYFLHLTFSYPIRRVAAPTPAPPVTNPHPFVPGTSTGYVETVIADGATHAWKYDEAAGDAIDYAGAVDLTIATTGSNPIREVSGPALIIDAKWMEFLREDTHGTVIASAQNDGADWPAGNESYTWEWWGDFVASFLDVGYYSAWGGVSGTILTVGGSPTSIVWSVSGVAITTTVGSTDISAYTGAGEHSFMFTYDGPTLTYSCYVDGVLRWQGTGDLPATTAEPSTAGGTTVYEFNALQDFKFGWQSLYPTALDASQAANHALGDGAVIPDSTVPGYGQPVGPESAVSDGGTTQYQTNFPYQPGSLIVKVNGVVTVVTETDPDTGLFTLAFPASLGSLITWTYQGTDGDPTGANNPSPPTSSPPPSGGPGTVQGGDGTYRQPQQMFTPAETPDGSRTVFTISPYIAGTSLVYINGLIQARVTDYAETSPGTGVITFTTPPSATDGIIVLAMPAAAVLTRPFPSPMTSATYTIPGSIDHTGATEVGALIDAWLATVPDHAIADFGGDTNVFQCHQGIQIPAGRHHLKLWGGSGVGAKIKGTSGTSGADQLNSQIIVGHARGGSWAPAHSISDIWIDNFVLEGNNPSPGAFTSGTEGAANLELTGCDRLEVSNVTGSKAWGDFLFYEDVTNGWAHDCHAIDAGRDGVSVISGDTILMQQMAFDRAGQNIIDVEPNTAAQACYRITLEDFTFGSFGNEFLGVEGTHTGAPIDTITVTRGVGSGAGATLRSTIDNGGALGTVMKNISLTNCSGVGTIAGPVVDFHHVENPTASGNTQALSSGLFASFTACTNPVT